MSASPALTSGETATPAKLPRTKRRLPTLGVLFAFTWLISLTVCTLFAAYIPFIRDYDTQIKVNGKTGRYNLGPGWTAWMGTDASSHDVFARSIHGARITLMIGVLATVMGLVLGTIMGVLAGYFGGKVDRVVSIIVDCLLALPALLLALLLVYRMDDLKNVYTWLGWLDRKWEITLTLGILATAPLARIVRAQTMALREREFVLAARSLGAKGARVIWREILPNLVPAMVTVAITGLGILIAAEGALAFLGLGVERPVTWGKMIIDGRADLKRAWWATVFPASFLFLTVVSFNLLGDRLARRFDIREAAI